MNTIPDNLFIYSRDQLKEVALNILSYAKEKGATEVATDITESRGLSISVRQGTIETIEQNKEKSINITVYIGVKKNFQRGNASTSDFSQKSLKTTVEAACNIAHFTAIDNCAGLPEQNDLEMKPRDLKLFSSWLISSNDAIKLAQRCEASAYAVSKNIINSEGANVYTQQSHFITANSHGFIGGYPFSCHTISVAPIASNGKQMQRADWYSSKRDPQQLTSPEIIGRHAAKRAIARLNASKLSTRKSPIMFEAPVAASLLNTFVQAISGGALYRKATFLLDSLGTQIFPTYLNIFEDPHIMSGMGSAPFDGEGVKTHSREVVKNGIICGYFLSTYSARKLGMKTTGNAGGSHNLSLTSSLTTDMDTFDNMLKKLHTGLLVTELMGHGINYVTGDYSRGASGFWVKNGIIEYPVEEITIAGNMKDMFRQIIAVGNDTFVYGSKKIGSIILENMMIAGN